MESASVFRQQCGDTHTCPHPHIHKPFSTPNVIRVLHSAHHERRLPYALAKSLKRAKDKTLILIYYSLWEADWIIAIMRNTVKKRRKKIIINLLSILCCRCVVIHTCVCTMWKTFQNYKLRSSRQCHQKMGISTGKLNENEENVWCELLSSDWNSDLHSHICAASIFHLIFFSVVVIIDCYCCSHSI